MNRRPYTPLSTALPALLLAIVAGAQEPPDESRAAGEAGHDASVGPVEQPARPATPHINRGGLRNLCSAIVATRPERLAPGESGALHVVLVLQREAVLVPGQFFELGFEKEQGPLGLGDWQLSEPKPALVAEKFSGQLVYDNTATIVLPVSVAPDAEFGDSPVRFSLTAEVSSATSGGSLGRFEMPIEGKVSIGEPVPRPFVRTPAAGGTEAPASAAATGAPDGSSGTGVSTAQAPPGPAGSSEPQAVAIDAVRDSDSAVPIESGESAAGAMELSRAGEIPILAIAGGLLVVVLAIALFLRGRR